MRGIHVNASWFLGCVNILFALELLHVLELEHVLEIQSQQH